jgi:hypothetical protein
MSHNPDYRTSVSSIGKISLAILIVKALLYHNINLLLISGKLMIVKKKGFSAMLKGSTIDLIKSRARKDGVSQATIIETAIDTYCGKRPDSETANSDSETSSEKSFLHREIEFKNTEINRLLDTINQQNHLLAAASKKEILLIEDKSSKKKGEKIKDAVATDIPTTTSGSKKKKGKGGRSSKSKKKKK